MFRCLVVFLALSSFVFSAETVRESDANVVSPHVKKLEPLHLDISPGPSVVSSTKSVPCSSPPLSGRLVLGPSVYELACQKLHQAIDRDSVNCAHQAFTMTPLDINTSLNEEGDTALMLALRRNATSVVLWLLESGANPLVANHCGCSAWSMVVTLCYKCTALGPRNFLGDPVYAVANIPYGCIRENAERVVFFAQYLPDMPAGIAKVDAPLTGINATIWEVESRTERGIVYRQLSEPLQTALAYAADNFNPFLVDILAKQGAHLNVRTPSGYTPLSLACIKGHNSSARQLVALGSEIDVWQNLTCPPDMLTQAFKVALTIGCKPLAEKIHAKGGVNIECSAELRRTLLMRTLMARDVKTALLLLDLGANFMAKDAEGNTASFYAKQAGLEDIVSLLGFLEMQERMELARKSKVTSPTKRNPLKRFGRLPED